MCKVDAATHDHSSPSGRLYLSLLPKSRLFPLSLVAVDVESSQGGEQRSWGEGWIGPGPIQQGYAAGSSGSRPAREE
jgi:hypothetical protein